MVIAVRQLWSYHSFASIKLSIYFPLHHHQHDQHCGLVPPYGNIISSRVSVCLICGPKVYMCVNFTGRKAAILIMHNGSVQWNLLKFASFNCKGLKSSIGDVVSLCENHDVIFLQETWLLPHDMHLLQNIHCEFYGDGISSIDTTEGILLGRPYGGLAVFWQKSLNTFVKVIKLEDETRLMGFDINFGTILYRAWLLSIRPFGTNFSEILIKIQIFSFKEKQMKMLSAKMAAILSRGRWVKML